MTVPGEVATVDNISIVYPETYLIELEDGIRIDVTEETYGTCLVGTEYPGCGE